MKPGLWLASAAAVTLVAGGVYLASPTLHGQAAPQAPAAGATPSPEADGDDDLGRHIRSTVEEALQQSGLRDGRLAVDVRRAVGDAMRHAQDVVRDLDVEVIVDDAMQDVAVLAGGRPRLGVDIRDLTVDEAKAAGLSGIAGAYVTDVAPDSAAAKAGLQPKDIIIAVDGEHVRSVRHLSRVVTETPEGRSLQVEFVRGTARQTVTVTPEVRSLTRSRRPNDADGGPTVRRFERRRAPLHDGLERTVPRGPQRDGDFQPFLFGRGPDGSARLRIGGRARLGVMAQPLTDQLATYFGVKNGVLVTEVTENSPAAKAGLKAGDVITSVNGKPVEDSHDIVQRLDDAGEGKTVPVELTRDRKSQTVTVTLETPSDSRRDRPAKRRVRFTA